MHSHNRVVSVLAQYSDYLNDKDAVGPPPDLINNNSNNNVDNTNMDYFIAPEGTAEVEVKMAKAQQKHEKKLQDKKQKLKHFMFAQMKEQKQTEAEIKKERLRIERLSEDDIDFELEKINFSQSEDFTEKVAHLIRDITGWVADKAVQGEGKVKKEFEEDKALKTAIAQRLMGKMGFLGLTGQIGLLAANDTFHGLKNKYGLNTNNNNSNNQVPLRENDAAVATR